MKLIPLIFLLALTLGFAASSEKIVCYFSSWAVWRPGDGQFDVEDVDPFLCTHAIFGFAGLSNQTWEIEVLDPWNELCPEDGGNNCAFDRFVALKEENPDLIVLLGIGGWNEGSDDYSVMAGDPEKRKSFIDSTVALVNKHKFDGMDLDWEYPAARGGVPEDKENFVTLSKELWESFNQFNPPLLLTTAMAAGKDKVDPAYDIPRLVDYYDQFHLMSYDFHGAWENQTHHQAPLCGHYLDTGDIVYYNLQFAVNYYLELGMPPEKLIMGVPIYGRCWTLDNIEDHGVLAPAHNPSPPGPYTKQAGSLGFNELCPRLTDTNCKVVRDPELREPYFYCTNDNVWCGYDDQQSIYEKARFARNSGLGGVLAWTIDTDDFIPACGYNHDFPLIRVMKVAFMEQPDGQMPDCPALTATPVPTTVEMTSTQYPPTQYPPTQYPPTQYPPTQYPPTQYPPTQYPPTQYPPTQYPPTQYPPTQYPPTQYPPTQYPPTQYPPTQYPPTEYPPTQYPPTQYPPTQYPPTQYPPTQYPPTQYPPTQYPPTTSAPGPHPKPDCSQFPDGSVFPHEDCNKYWVCVNGQAILELCGPGTLFDEDLSICNWEDQVDTSQCTLWICEVDNTYIPHEDCDKYYRCYQGSPHEEQCPDGLYWNQALTICDDPTHVNTNNCNEP